MTILLLLCLPIAFGALRHPSALLGERPQVLLLGDSIVEEAANVPGWGTLLGAWYNRRLDVIVRGFGGATTRHIRSLVSQNFADGPPPFYDRVHLVVLCIGANDASAPGTAAHVPLPDFLENLDAILSLLKMGLPFAEVLAISPPAVDEDALRAYPALHLGRASERTGEYAHSLVDLVSRRGLRVYDLYSDMMSFADWRSLLRDGLHLNGRGSYLAFKGITDALVGHPAVLLPQSLPTHLPGAYAMFDEALNRSDCGWPGNGEWFC